MKLERLFECKDSKLYKTDGRQVEVTPAMIKKISWNDVEGAEEVYNEQFLASLRDELKALDDKGEFVFIEPVYDKKGALPGQFINAMKHTSRRIKDCVSVIGFAVPDEIASDSDVVDFYTKTVAEKHAHYVFFSKKDCGSDIVLY